MSTMPSTSDNTQTSSFELSPQQATFFDTFGFLRIPGLFADDIERITRGFEEVFANEANDRWESHEELHFGKARLIIPGFIHKSPDLAWLLDDPRVIGVVSGVMAGRAWEYAESDGNIFSCESSWHPDTYSAPLTRYHVKLSFYLDELVGASGAIRVIPGTNHQKTPYARMLRRTMEDPARIEEIYGVRPDEIPSVTLESTPGDLLMWNFRTIHASFHGGERRRLFSVNFRETETGDPVGSD